MRSVLLLVLIIGFTSCEIFGPASTGEVQGDAEVRVQVATDALVVTNRSGDDLYYFVMGETVAPLILWAPIPTDENRIQQRRTQRIAFDDISMDQDRETKLLFHWWHADEAGTGPDSVRVFSVEL
ncbi:MAG: hypothetical protein RhofKO_32390 [Rhodothermales bacterium]